MNGIESGLDKMFKVVPSLPENARKALAKALPWIALVGGILSLIGCWYLYQAASLVNQLYGYADSLYSSLGYATGSATGETLFLWISLALLVAQAVLMLVAFPGLRTGKKIGWNLMLWSAFANIVYDVIYSLFGYGYLNIGQMILYLVGALIGLYLLFQVRPYFMGAAARIATPAATKPVDKK